MIPLMVRAVLLDVNGTLTDPSAIGAVWARPDLGEHVLQHAISTAMVGALLHDAGRPFRDHLSAAIDVVVAAAGLDPHASAQALDSAASLPARPGAADALATLRDANLRIVALTNSGADGGRTTLEACGLLSFIEQVLGVDAVSTFKPHPDVYAYALSQLDEDPDWVALIAPHPWDLAGAAHGGMRTAWVRHGPRAWPSVFPSPDVQADTLPDLAKAILAHRWYPR
jgi:2-haloacid dehalogenase